MLKYSKSKISGLFLSKWESLDVWGIYPDSWIFSLHRTELSLQALWNVSINSSSLPKTSYFQLVFHHSDQLQLAVAQQTWSCKFGEEYYSCCPSFLLKLMEGQRGTHSLALGLYNKCSYEYLCLCLPTFTKVIDVLFPAQIHQFFQKLLLNSCQTHTQAGALNSPPLSFSHLTNSKDSIIRIPPLQFAALWV